MIALRDYQELAVGDADGEGLAAAIARLVVQTDSDRRIVFQAPTGSGKTVMLAAALDRAARGSATLWLSPGGGDLHLQSASSLQDYLSDSPLSVQVLDDPWVAAHSAIGPGTVLVANWQSVFSRDRDTGGYRNTITRDGETRNFFEVLQQTANEATPLIIVIDESHWGADAERTNAFLADVGRWIVPLIIEASATPTQPTDAKGRADGRHVDVLVPIGDVVAEGMIRSRVVVNAGVEGTLMAMTGDDREGATGESLVLQAAWDKRSELMAAFERQGSPVRPLLLVQVPNGRLGEEKRRAAETFFAEQGVTADNGRLAVYMADERSAVFDDVSSNDSTVDVVIFKIGIATGWDCPRAQILVAFREMAAELLRVQTVGRILRTPERRHYGTSSPDPLLDSAYVYSNIDAPTGPVDMDPDIDAIAANITLYRDQSIPDLVLPASYASRAGTYNDVQPRLFRECFEEAAAVTKLASRLPLEPTRVADFVVSDQEVEVVTQPLGADEARGRTAARVSVRKSATDLQEGFEGLLADHLGGYRGRARSIPRMSRVIYGWVQQHMHGWWAGDESQAIEGIQATFQSGEPEQLLGATLDIAIQEHLARDAARSRVIEHFDWHLPDVLRVSSQSHSVLTPDNGYAFRTHDGEAWRTAPSGPERTLEQLLATHAAEGRITWWWKNGEMDRAFFSLHYTDATGLPATFFPDYVGELPSIKAGRRRIFIIEAKHIGDVDPNTPPKAAALADYTARTAGPNLDLISGIVVPNGSAIMIHPGFDYTNPSSGAVTKAGTGWGLLDSVFDD